MDYQVRFRAIRDEKILCEVVGLDEKRRPTGPVVARGVGISKAEAMTVTLAATEDPDARNALLAAGAKPSPT